MQKRRRRAVANASNISFELHSLGWEAFQNLCGHVAREVLGQTVTVFSATNDAGQDGAFQGKWRRRSKEPYTGRFILQCKFTARKDAHLSVSNLNDEIAKARRLVAAGVAQTYLLITNFKLTGESDVAIRDAFSKISGLKFFDILGEEWITQSIAKSKTLRAFVPRVYGLGDLSQILDERVYRQANEILQSWKDNLAKFVPTEAHEQSVRALVKKGFVLLLGDPMAGKSTIAAALALAASDRWNCLPVFVHHPDDIKHWNPDEPNQFFWVDDAFGQIQMESHLTAGWNSVMPHMAAAIRKGARILFTSRTYVYRDALKELKASAFPLLRDSTVIINVENLTLTEKEKILYNHLRLGTQPREVLTKLKPHLPDIAANKKFFPEVAKRLGDTLFTKNLAINFTDLQRFVEEPLVFLCDVISELNKFQFAALSLLFMRAGRIHVPPRIDGSEIEALELLGANLAGVNDSLRALDGSLVSQVLEGGERYWTFRHPTVRDAMALHIAERPELLDIYLGGVKVTELLSEVVCGTIELKGAKVHVPESRFQVVISKIDAVDFSAWNIQRVFLGFLLRRCDDKFILKWREELPLQLNRIYDVFAVSEYSFSHFIARLHRLGKLPEDIRLQYLRDLERAAFQSAESIFLEKSVRKILTPDEFNLLIKKIKVSLAPSISALVEEAEENYDDPEYDVSDHFSDLRNNFESFRNFFADDEDDDDYYSMFDNGIDEIDNAIERIEERNEEIRQQKEEEEEQERVAEEDRRKFEEKMDAKMSKQRLRVASESRKDSAMSSGDVSKRSIFEDVDE